MFNSLSSRTEKNERGEVVHAPTADPWREAMHAPTADPCEGREVVRAQTADPCQGGQEAHAPTADPDPLPSSRCTMLL
jgi:hypothetical protein